MIDPVFSRARTVLLVLLAYCPAFLTVRLIARFGIDLPVADDWNMVPFLLKAHEHSLGFFDFFTQQNEHRYALPKLVLLILTPLASGNVKAEMFCSVIMAVLASGAVWYLLCRTVDLSLTKRLLLLGLVNLLLFGPVQAGNWTWGCQFVLFMVNVLLLTGIAVAVSRLSLSAKFVACTVIAVVATFTFGGGVVTWLIIFPVALLYETRVGLRQRCWWLAGWLFASAVTMKGYFFHYVKPGEHPPLAASHNPVDYFRYISTFLGNHLSKAAPNEPITLAATLGTILMLLYFGGALWTLRSRDANFKRKMLPWLGIGAFALINAALAAVTRIGFGISQGLDSRYTTFSLYISISVVGMFALVAVEMKSAPDVDSRAITRLRWLQVVGLAALLVSHVYASTWGVRLFRVIYQQRLHGKAAFLFINLLEAGPAQGFLAVGFDGIRESANGENHLGFLHPPLLQSPELSKLDSHPQLAGFLESVSLEGQTCKAFGWAMIPKGYRPADAVLLAYDDPTRGPIAFALTVPTGPRPDVVQATHDNRLELSGWSYEFQRSKVPPGNQRITAWAFDAEKVVLYPLILGEATTGGTPEAGK